MSGPRHLDWTHVHVPSGDRAAAAPYLSFGRKLLGYTIQQAKAGNLLQHEVTKRLDDGAVVTAELRGTIPRITIEPPTDERIQRFEIEGVVVTSRSANLRDGIRLDANGDPAGNAQQIIAPSGKVYTFDGNVEPGVVSDGTYKPAFPGGIEQAGNVDWTDGQGVWISWYGPTLRYWFDTYRRPNAQYGPWVFLNGGTLLDIEAYATENSVTINETLVLGAALVGTKLYVMQAQIGQFPQDTASDDYTNPADGDRYGWISSPYPPGTTSLRLCRYTIVRRAGALPTQLPVMVAAGSLETLWTDTRRGTVNPWVFNPDATKCETFAMPNELRTVRHLNIETGVTTLHHTQSSSSQRIALDIAANGTVSTTVENLSVTVVEPASNASASTEWTIAADYTPEGFRRELRMRADYVFLGVDPDSGGDIQPTRIALRIDAGPPVVIGGVSSWATENPAQFPRWGTNIGELHEVCIRDGRMALMESQFLWTDGLGDSSDYRMRFALYRDGAIVSDQRINFSALNSGLLFPMSRLYNTFVNKSRPWTLFHGVLLDYEGNTAISPLATILGMTVSSTTDYRFINGSDQWAGTQSRFTGGYFYKDGSRFDDDEVEGFCCAWQGGSSSGYGTFFAYGLALTGYEDGSRRTAPQPDTRARLTPASGAVSKDGGAFSSFTALVAYQNRPGGVPTYYTAKLVSGQFAPGATLSTLTGVPSGGDSINVGTGSSTYAFDARFSTIWRLGKWPRV